MMSREIWILREGNRTETDSVGRGSRICKTLVENHVSDVEC